MRATINVNEKESGKASFTTNVNGRPCSFTECSPIENDWPTARNPYHTRRAENGITKKAKPTASITNWFFIVK